MTDHVLEVEGLVAGYSGVPAVHDLTLTVDAGEVVSLLGPNGAGKSTTLLTIAGSLPALRGAIRLKGAPVRAKAAHHVARLGVSLVPEDRGVFFQLTVAENLRVRGSRSHTSTDQVYEWFPKLHQIAGRKAGLLSGGEQQILALGCALMRAPSLLMIDEMSHGLAPVIVQQMMPILRTLADSGTAVLLVEQHVHAAIGVSDRVYVLNRGRLMFDGDARTVRADPRILEESYLGRRTTSDSTGF